tara:strand:+ start:73 stop:957 length:885 start_codon:yes stop_codon:yes gene_type:complete
MIYEKGKWCGGLAEWTEGETAFLSVAFTWRLDEAYSRAIWYHSQGYKVHAGGPGVFTQKKYLADVAEISGDYPDAVSKQNPQATFASRGCPVGCWFCIVPKMEGREFTLFPDFPVRPVLCDNNLSALPADFQDHIVSRYKAEGVPLLDANSGFEPRTFDEEVYHRWKPINKGPWRFAYDDQGDGPHVERVMKMLEDEPQSRKRVYVLIGNEPKAECLERINKVISWGGDPHVQPFIKLNALRKKYHVRHDWTEGELIDMARWTNGWVWKKAPFSEYRRTSTPVSNPLQMEMGEI